jgi:hypothetical protein
MLFKKESQEIASMAQAKIYIHVFMSNMHNLQVVFDNLPLHFI